MPSNWKTVKLGDCIDYIKGFPFKSKDYQDSGTRIIRVSDLGKNFIHDNNPTFIQDSEAAKYSRWSLRDNDLICTTVGSKPPQYDSLVGRVVRVNKANIGSLLNQNTVLLRAKKQGEASQQYISSQFLTKKYVTFIEGIIRGNANQGSITLEDLFEYPFNLPPPSEQLRITEILQTWNQCVEKLDKKIIHKKNVKKGLMQKLLTGQVRLPGFTEVWSETELYKICDIKKGYGLSKETLVENGRFECILYGELYTKYGEIIDHTASRTDSNEGTASRIGDILIPASTTTSHLDLAIAASVKSDNIRLGGDINILRAKQTNTYNSDFLAYYLTHARKHELARLAQGITIVHLYGKDFKKINVSLPPIKEQREIVRTLITAESEISLLEKKRHELSRQGKYLLSNLLFGKIQTQDNLKLTTDEVAYA